MGGVEVETRVSSNVLEAANRAEATALLFRCGYRVYRPEADVEGEDLVVRTPEGELLGVQLKGRATVHWARYGGRKLRLLFPSEPYVPAAARRWYLVPHDEFFEWVRARHGHAAKWSDAWSYPYMSKDLVRYCEPWMLSPADGIE